MGISKGSRKEYSTMKTNTKKNIKKILASRKFKYGSVAIAFTVIFCAVVILFNAVLTVVSNYNGGFYIDLTEEKIYDLSDKTLEVLNNLDKKVEIIFCTTEDRIDDDNQFSYIKRLAQKYETASSNISVTFKDSLKDPIYFNQFKKTSSDVISQQSVIINCEETKQYVVYSASKFFKYDSETATIFAYDGENKFTGAILQTASTDTAKAGIITNHGEKAPNSLALLLREQGYDVSSVDLEKISENELFSYDLLVISNPVYDYTGIAAANEGGRNEIALLNTYLTKQFGNLMVFINSETANTSLAEFSGFLADDWGISYTSGDILFEDAQKAIDSTGIVFFATPSSGNTAGAKIHSSLTATAASRAIFGQTTPLHVLFETRADKNVSVVFETSLNAVLLRGETAAKAASVPIMTLSTYTKMYNNEEYRANVLVCGSTYFLNQIDNYVCSNTDVLKNALVQMGNNNILTGIDYKVVDDTALAISMNDFKKYTVMLSTIIPLIISAVGIYVYIKRKKA